LSFAMTLTTCKSAESLQSKASKITARSNILNFHKLTWPRRHIAMDRRDIKLRDLLITFKQVEQVT
jgi:hypothetical protein